jgi:membrane-bound lytic murein transglycosylase B
MLARPLALALLAAALVHGGPAGAAPEAAPDAASAPAPAAAPESIARVTPALAGVAVEGAAAREAQARYDAIAARLEAARSARATAEAELVTLAARDVALTERIAVRTDDRKAAALRLADARRAVQQVAAGAYVVSATYNDVTRLVDLGSTTEIGTGQVLSAAVQEDRQAVQTAARVDVVAASNDIDLAQRERTRVRDRQAVVTGLRDRAIADEQTATTDLGVALFDLNQLRAVARVRGVDFALVALDAYVTAAATQPACGIEWWALAGISRVEGRHGTYGGASLRADGQVTRPIIGIPLTGENGTRAIGDTDGGRLDGDPSVDRAVGPMQFIPSTWARWGRDGDGDGDEDPQNLYDATAAAAAYLCNGRRLTDEAGLRAGYFSYNHSEAYVESVLGYARGYARFRIPDPPPPPPVEPTIPV